MADEEGKQAISRITEMKSKRKSSMEPWWKDVAEVLIPRLSDLDGTKTSEALLAPGFYDSQGRSSLEVASNAVFSLMVGHDVDWLSFGMFNNPEVMRDRASREYFDRMRIGVLDVLYANGFYENVKPAVETGMSIGTVATTVTRELNSPDINYILWHPGDIFIRKGGDRRIAEVAVRQNMKYKDLNGQYEKLPPKVVEKMKADPNGTIDIYYYINKLATDGTSPLADFGMKYYLMHVTEDGDTLHASGLQTLPGAFWTFEADPRLDYGLCPGYHTLRDLMQNNKIRKMLLQETEKRIKPPLWVPEQGSSQLHAEPDSINYFNGDPSLFPRNVFQETDVSLAFQIKEEINNIIRIRFYTDFFLAVMSKSHRRTAQEIAATQNEVGSQIGPLVYGIERNYLAPQIKRTLMIMQEMGKLPEPTNKILQNTKDFPLEVKYIGPLSLAQRYQYHTVKNTQLLTEVLIPAAQLDPTSVDYINIGRLVQESTMGVNGGFGVIRDESEVLQIREARALAQQQAQQEAMAMEAMKQPNAAQPGSPAEQVMNG
jgi:hypothetical protein